MNEKDDTNIDGYASNTQRDQFIADILLRVTVLENLLISKGLITEAEIQVALKELSLKIASIIGINVPPKLTGASSDIQTPDQTQETNTTNFYEHVLLTTTKISKGN